MSQRQEFQGVAESSGRSKSAILTKGTFGRKDEVSYEKVKYSGEAKPEYFTDSRAEPTPKRRGRKPKRTFETFKSELKESKISKICGGEAVVNSYELNSDELRSPEFQGVAESIGRSKSAIFGRDENSDELRSLEFTTTSPPQIFEFATTSPPQIFEFPRTPMASPPEYFTVSYENPRTPSAARPEYFTNSYKTPQIRLQTFHFHFSEELVERFTYFATLHRFDERKAYKENWIKWIAEDDVNECIAKEVERLTSDGYTGDILDKMFKSVRYYYRKKPLEPVPPKIRKSYESFPQDVLQRIDEHILDQIRNHANSDELRSPEYFTNSYELRSPEFPRTPSAARPDSGETKSRMKMKNTLISPAKAFANYKVVHESEITAQTEPKYKKTYKNRFFLFTKHIRRFTESNAQAVVSE
jgi:hypothetical protein